MMTEKGKYLYGDITARYFQSEVVTEEQHLVLTTRGPDMGNLILIGVRAKNGLGMK
mgnify:CR=1 FL=1